ncbi:MAG: hypothetical protein KAT70_06060, partial [Thermoplasmata archaeon]|nr:hypothetical protein [Thermoplasmata archaeon]
MLFGLVGTVHAGNFPPTAPQVPYVPGAVIITGGTIDDTIIGGTTPAAGTFDPVKTTDTNDSHALSIIWNEDDSANRTINIVVNAGNRTLDLSENLTVGGGSAFTLTAEDTAGSILLDEQTFEVEGQGTATQLTKLVNANNAAATLTIEGTGAVVGQDTTADAAVTFAGVTIGAADDFFLDGGTDTKIEEISADATAFWVGGVEGARIAESARTIESDATVCETDGGDLRIVTVADHDVYLNDVAQFADGTGGLCTGLAAATNYYVTQRDDAKKFNVATSRGGSNITFTDAGTAFTSYDMEIDTWVYGRLQLPSNDDPANPTLCFNGGGTCNSGYMESEENTLDTIINGTTE